MQLFVAHGFNVDTRIDDKRLCIAAARGPRYEEAACGEAETKNYNEKKINAADASTYNTTRSSAASVAGYADDFTVADCKPDSDATTNSVRYSRSARYASDRPRSPSDAHCARDTSASSRTCTAEA